MKNYQSSLSKSKSNRRSHAESRDGLFINNWSAFEEYLKSAPKSLSNLACASADEIRLNELRTKYEAVDLDYVVDPKLETGIRANVAIEYLDEEKMLEEAALRRHDLIIACDHITDTRNLGAIARTAAFFGLRNIILPKDRQASITSGTMAVAQGAFATIKPSLVTNLSRTLLSLKECGYWIATADMKGADLNKFRADYNKLVLVLGSEDKGVSAQIRNKSDLLVSIPSMGGSLDSLNVSVAAGILIYKLKSGSNEVKNFPPT